MGWRKDFKDTLINELEKIPGVGSVKPKWKQEASDYPALTISLTSEVYERTMGSSTGPAELYFEILGKVKDIDDIEDALEELLDNVIEKLEGISSYDTDGALLIEDTAFHERTETEEMTFSLSGKLVKRKDYANM